MDYHIFGLQRTGTNYLEALINHTFSKKRIGEYKHGHRISVEDDKPIFVIYKNPYTWIESVSFRDKADVISSHYKFRLWQKPDDEDYIVGPNKLNLFHLIEIYKEFINNTSGYYRIKYEDLLDHDKRNLIIKDISIKHLWAQYNKWNHKSSIGKIKYSPIFNESWESYYRNGNPMQLKSKQVRKITESLTPELITGLGYKYL